MALQSPFEILSSLIYGHVANRCLYVAAELGVADALGDASRAIDKVATQVGADPDALFRLLRVLASYAVFTVDGRFVANTPASELLRTDHPQSLRAHIRLLGLPVNWNSLRELQRVIETGEPSTPLVAPEGYWGYFAARPAENRIFNYAMSSKGAAQVAGVLDAYDFGRHRTIADIGGGNGHLLAAILESAPAAKGILFDQPHVIATAAAAPSSRLKLQAGDFFAGRLPTCDLYLLMEVIHDWNDEKAAQILASVRQAAPENARILLIERMIEDNSLPQPAKAVDILMLIYFGGKQRTLEEYIKLLEQTGWRFERITPTSGGVDIVEAVAM